MSHSYDPKSRKREGLRVKFQTTGPSMTLQSSKDEVDINNIVARFRRTGEMPQRAVQPQFADISDIQQKDPTTALNDARATITTVQTDLQTFRETQNQEKQKLYKQQLKEEILRELESQKAPENPAPASGG